MLPKDMIILFNKRQNNYPSGTYVCTHTT